MTKVITYFTCIIIAGFVLDGCATMMGAKAEPEMRTFEKIIEVKGKTKDQIYIKANSWFVETFNSAESVIEFKDKEAGKIIGKYAFNYSEGVYKYRVKQTVDIEIKDDKIRIKINNPQYRATSGMGEPYYHTTYKDLETKKGLERARNEWTEFINSLQNYLNKNDEW